MEHPKTALVLIAVAIAGAVGCTHWTRRSPEELCGALITQEGYQSKVLDEIISPPHREEKITALFAKWGRHSDEYDRIIVERVVFSEYLDETVFKALQSRLREEPSLFLQLCSPQSQANEALRKDFKESPESFDLDRDCPAIDLDNGHVIEFFRPRKKDSPWVMELCYQSIFVLYRDFNHSPRGKLRALLDFAIYFNRPEVITNLTMDQLDDQWFQARAWMREHARYVYFDEQTGAYLLDEEAARQRKPVAPERQIPGAT